MNENNLYDTKIKIKIIRSNNYKCSLSFTSIVQKVEYLYSTTILNDVFKPNKQLFFYLVYSRYQCLALDNVGDITISYCPERLITYQISPSLKSFILDVFTNQIHLPPVRTLSRLTNPQKDVKRYVMADTSFNGLRLC